MSVMLLYFLVREFADREIEDGLLCQPPTYTHMLRRLQSIILIPTTHTHTHVSKGTGLSSNLAHSTGWGNQLRPDWQPPFLILFPCSLLHVLFLLLWSFFFPTGSALTTPPSPLLPRRPSSPLLFLHLPRSWSSQGTYRRRSPAPSMHSDPHSPPLICPPRPLAWFLAQMRIYLLYTRKTANSHLHTYCTLNYVMLTQRLIRWVQYCK